MPALKLRHGIVRPRAWLQVAYLDVTAPHAPGVCNTCRAARLAMGHK